MAFILSLCILYIVWQYYYLLVHLVGLEPTRLSTTVSKTVAATYYATSAFGAYPRIRTLKHLILRQAAIPIRADRHGVNTENRTQISRATT